MGQSLIGIIGGTGLDKALTTRLENAVLEDMDTPFGKPSAPVLIGELGASRIAFLSRHGCGHRYNPSTIPYAANIFALKKLGVTALIASGAVGSLQQKIAPGHLVLVDQFIDKTFRRQNTFFDSLGAVHCEFSHPCCGRLREKLRVAAEEVDTVTHTEGTYVCMEGPQFSTRAESLMHRQWGADLIGMTAMPEARLAREAQICYALVAMASDYDCWRDHDPAKDKQGLLEEIISNLNRATQNAVALIETLLQSGAPLCDDACECRKSLDQAVWTDSEFIDPETKLALAALFE
ncbi:MAG: S-methyl-5'-thioadenosine phosphorylase [Planctomycetota bacterium]|jgi:5'-methylthioadenosine phosphorylase